MLRFILLLLVFSYKISLFASNYNDFSTAFNEREPNILFDECVNVISGNFVLDDEIIVNGTEPIKLKKSYFSLNNNEQLSKDIKNHDKYIMAGWSYHDIFKAYFYGDRIDIAEPTGEIHSFSIPYSKNKKSSYKEVKTLQYINTSFLPNRFSDEKIFNPKDLKVQADGQANLTIYYPNGSEKFYEKESNSNIYLLRSHTLINRNKLKYFYNKYNKLTEIRSTNPNETKIYAWIKFIYNHSDPEYREKNNDKYDFTIETSDNKKYEFKHKNYYPLVANKERSFHPFFILDNIISNQSNYSFDYHLDYKNTHPLLKKAKLPNKTLKEISYYLLGNKNPEVNVQFNDINDFRFERVKTLKEPNEKGFFDLTYKFFYDPSSSTTIYDKDNNKYIYFYNNDSKIVKIQKFSNQNNQYHLLNEQRFVWEKINDIPKLTSKAFLDSGNQLVFAKRFFYDKKGNLIEEKLYTDITGANEKTTLDKNNIPQERGDILSIRYKYSDDNKNLLIEKSDASNIITRFSYLPNTNILSSKIVLFENQIKKRYFYFYNEDFILTQKIEDDGGSLEQNNLQGITFRKIIYFYPKSTYPFVGFTEKIEEKYLDLKNFKEKLIKKEVFKYSNTGHITNKEIYSTDDKLAYTLNFEYDSKGNLISKTDQLNRKFSYSYDENNNLTSERYLNKSEEYSYNLSNLLTKKSNKCENFQDQLLNFYDANKNKVFDIDHLGNESKYEYDNFSNHIATTSYKLVENKKEPVKETYILDPCGNRVEINQNNKIIKILYNIFSKPLLYIHPDNSTEKFIYNLDGTLKTSVDQKFKTHYTYDYLKRLTNKKTFNHDGKLLDDETYKYNSYALIEKKDKEKITKYFYDFAKRLIKEEKIYNDDIFTTEYFYDSLSNINKIIYNKALLEVFQRDLLNRIVDIEKQDIDQKVLYKKSFKYDDLENISYISYIEDNKAIEKHIFDPYHRLIKKIDPLRKETLYKYEIFEYQDLKFIKQKIFSENKQEEKLFDKDGKIYLLEKKDSSGKTFYKEEYYYDLYGNLSYKKEILIKDQKNNIKETFYTFDVMNRVTTSKEIENNIEKITNYKYSSNKNIEIIEKPNQIILEKKYDCFNNLISLSSSDKTLSLEFEYNNFNLPTKIIDFINNTQTIREYNNFGKLIKEKQANGLEIVKEYDNFTRNTKILLPDNSSIEYIYNPVFLEKVTRKDSKQNELYSNKYLKYDLSGNLLQEELIGNLGYLNHLDQNENPAFNNDSLILKKTDKYDLENQIEKIDWEIHCKTGYLDMNCNNFNTELKQKSFFEEDSQDQDNFYTYDKNGNIIKSEKDDIEYFYDSLNRLTIAKTKDTTIEFTYDGLNRKMQKKVYKNNKIISDEKFLYNDDTEIGLCDAKNNIFQLKVLNQKDNKEHKSIAFEINNKIFVPLYDDIGSVTSLISLNKTPAQSYNYGFFGETTRQLINNYASFLNPWQYMEKRVDEDLNVIYMDSIFYDPFKRKILNPNVINLFNDPSKRAFLSYIKSDTAFKKNNIEEHIQNAEISFKNPFKPQIKFFFKDIPFLDDKENISIKFSKESLNTISSSNIKIEQILDILAKPTEIENIENSIFILTNKNKNLKVTIDMANKEILNIEKN